MVAVQCGVVCIMVCIRLVSLLARLVIFENQLAVLLSMLDIGVISLISRVLSEFRCALSDWVEKLIFGR